MESHTGTMPSMLPLNRQEHQNRSRSYKKMKTLLAILVLCIVASAHSVVLQCVPPTTGDPVTGYNFYRSAVSKQYSTKTGTSTTCGYTDNSVVGGNTYYYVVRSYNAKGESKDSTEFKAVIPLSV